MASRPSGLHLPGQRHGQSGKKPELLFEKEERPAISFHHGIEEKASGKVIGDIYVYLTENKRMASAAIRLAPARRRKTVNNWCDHDICGILAADIR